MSMSILSAVQATVTFLLYALLVFAIPYVILGRLLKPFRVTTRLLLAFTCGNFFIVNLVLLLQLLHISNRFTLIFFSIAAIVAYVIIAYHWDAIGFVKNCWKIFYKTTRRQLGLKTMVYDFFGRVFNTLGTAIKGILKFTFTHIIDLAFFAIVTGVVVYAYGNNIITNYGYCASDMPVHNYWINYMGKGQLFVAGVYPFGFHCIMYYMHSIFQVETYVLLRVFCLTQTVLVHLMIVLCLKCICKARFLPYLAGLIYGGVGIFSTNTFSRYTSSLPQEFGMVFILPTIYFGFAFFEAKKRELKGEPETREYGSFKSTWFLVGFAMSFSLTLAVHFYGTMIAGLFCLAMAIGYFFRFLRPRYFITVIATMCISTASAVLPMALAYASGTALQGSLGWGLNVINSSSYDDDDYYETSDVIDVSTMSFVIISDYRTFYEYYGLTDDDGNYYDLEYFYPVDAVAELYSSVDEETVERYREHFKKAPSTLEITEYMGEYIYTSARYVADLAEEKAYFIFEKVNAALDYYIFSYDNEYFSYSVWIAMGLMLAFALLYFMVLDPDYAGQLITLAVGLFFLCCLLIASKLGLPTLMDGSRCSIYTAYFIPIIWIMPVDAAINLVLRWFKRPWILALASLPLVVYAGYIIYDYDLLRDPIYSEALETNEAVTCLTNIILENDDWTWTIVSANDELRMGEDYGYHTETIELLEENRDYDGTNDYTIPTQYVYFFIEKIPIDYTVSYSGSGQSVSEEGASETLPKLSGLTQYQGEKRWITMSHFYYWAQALMELYPNEVSVYYEDDNFVCYKLEQNINNLFNLCIDYGYNTQ